MEKLAAPGRRYYWPQAIWTVMAFEARRLGRLTVPLVLFIIFMQPVFWDYGNWDWFLAEQFGENFGQPYRSIWLAWAFALLPALGAWRGHAADLRHGFHLLATAPGPALCGRFVLGCGLGLLGVLGVIFGGGSSMHVAIAWPESWQFWAFGLLAVWLPLATFFLWLNLLTLKYRWVGVLIALPLLYLVFGGELNSRLYLWGEPGPDFPALPGYLLNWPMPLPERVLPASAHPQVVVFPGIPWGWALLGLGLSVLFLLGSYRLANGSEFSQPRPWWRRSRVDQPPKPALWTMPALKPASALGALIFSSSRSRGLPGGLWFWPLAGFGIPALLALINWADVAPPGRNLMATGWLLLMWFFFLWLPRFARGRVPDLWPPKAAPGIPCSPALAVGAEAILRTVELGLFAIASLAAEALVLWAYGLYFPLADILSVTIYILGVFALPLAGATVLLNAWRAMARRLPTWLILLIGLGALGVVATGIWSLAGNFLPPWSLVGPGFPGASVYDGLDGVYQEPFWLSLLVGIGAFLLAARVYEEVEA